HNSQSPQPLQLNQTTTCQLLQQHGYISSEQLSLCLGDHFSVLAAVSGRRLGLSECFHQFRYERWNCSATVARNIESGGKQRRTKEQAFMQAVMSAGVVFTVTEACSSGKLLRCSCLSIPSSSSSSSSSNNNNNRFNDDTWKWGGCSDDIDYGLSYAKLFTDKPIKKQLLKNGIFRMSDLKGLVDLHNNEVGRQILSSLMKIKCRCHGVSGLCGVRTCWKSLPTFREVGDALKNKYETSIEISRPSQHLLKREKRRRRREPISSADLIFLKKSPDYCKQNLKKGIPGTRGRLCNKNSTGPDGCDYLCCGRGFNLAETRLVERCHCKFIWCCSVQCKMCERVEIKYTCK
ncbi:hypothetical protein HELRODRAFT_89495, partial [Helobdella robusta]|uniref:Protein Wnt n=1 Tax=Helobdella robusta TaxID=6412 RepID=T1G7D5_HELRO